MPVMPDINRRSCVVDLIGAGKICRDAGFNWGRGSWWLEEKGGYFPVTKNTIEVMYDEYVPALSFGATRGVIIEWAREKSGNPTLYVFSYFNAIAGRLEWDVASPETEALDFEAETEIECYARLCQWVKENSK